MFQDPDKSCVFCSELTGRITNQNTLAFVIRDQYPVTEHHSLVIPKRHVADYFELTQEEQNACHELLLKTKNELTKNDPKITAFNIGINIGSDAGQTVFHCHIHLIPRRKGDVENPRGGIRNVIPGKGDY